MKRSLLALGLGAAISLSLSAPLAVMADDANDDALDNNVNPYIVNRDIEVGNITSGSIDLKDLKVVPPQMYLELRLRNSSSNPVNVRIPALTTSLLVPANGERIHYLNNEEVGYQQYADFTAEQIVTKVNQEISTSSIQHILSSAYTAGYQESYREESASKKEWKAAPATTEASVRGYW